jgi:pyruvate/2-oxoglutarate/acetoin dehydrogenase E1 component
VEEEVQAAVKFAIDSPEPETATALEDVFAPVTFEAADVPAEKHDYEGIYATAINEALSEEMQRDERVFLLGEDQVHHNFGVTADLADNHPGRVIDTPVSESAIVGAAVGAAMVGLRPVAEIMFFDFITCAMDPLVNQAAKMRYITGGQVTLPLVVRTAGGGGLFSAGAQHSQCLEAMFMHIPGLKVAVPATPYDAKGLLKTAIRDDNPVLFVESKGLYFAAGSYPEGEYLIPFGVADIKRQGTDVTVVAVQNMVGAALAAAEELAEEGIQVEVVDPRTLVPLDTGTILKSVEKTNRLIIAEEGVLTAGVGAEIAAFIAQHGFDFLDAPIVRVATPDIPMPFGSLEAAILPNQETIAAAVREVCA